MSKRINDKGIKINGAKFKELLETTSGKTLKEISLENGFSDSFLRMVVKSGKATPTAQAVARLYGIEPSAYEVKEVALDPKEDKGQISIEDLAAYTVSSVIKEAVFVSGRNEFKAIVKEAICELIHRDDLKELVKEAISEALSPCIRVTGVEYDPISMRFKLFVNKEDIR